ncbi:protein FAM83H [Polypterus senegalus]|nr:protein FAM83H [Polypterus senegalus]
MARRSQSSSQGDNPLDPNYLDPHYREEYRLAIDVLTEGNLETFYEFLQGHAIVNFLAQPEIVHIQKTLQVPKITIQQEPSYAEGVYTDHDSSSGTYWPMESDVEVPGLDLGWPHVVGFTGPTEVTTLVNPSDPDMPSIKEQARRLIKNARQVIAVVMDIFTDVDLFADLLEAASRRVPVYILLDEINSYHFVRMVFQCKVNLDFVHFMRIRTVSGITYFCRTGKSFKGQLMERFLLVDCRAVLSGNYSFMWSFEKIHRCIAHLFLGELVASFDEEFRILFAQSQPLVFEKALMMQPEDSDFNIQPYGHIRPPPIKKPLLYFPTEGSVISQHSSCSYGERMDMERENFRREDPFRHAVEGAPKNMYGRNFGPQLEAERVFQTPRHLLMASRQMDMDAFKRHSYAEGTNDNYLHGKQIIRQRMMKNVDPMENQSSHYLREPIYQMDRSFQPKKYGGPGSGHNIYDRGRSNHMEYQEMEDYSDDSRFTQDVPGLAPQHIGGYQQMLDYVPSNSSKEVKHGSGRLVPGDGRLGHSTQKRQNTGHTYICQSSPTQKHPPDQKQLFHESSLEREGQDPNIKQGLRTWRISSYLNTYQEGGDEGLQHPLDSETFDEPQEEASFAPEASLPRFAIKETPKVPAFKRTEPQFLFRSSFRTVMDAAAEDTEVAGKDVGEDAETKESRDISLTKHESMRSRLNPYLQRNSRLRSSLIFSSSKLEQHSSSLMKNSSGLAQKDQPTGELIEENAPVKISLAAEEILERKKLITREPFEFKLTDQSKVASKDQQSEKAVSDSTEVTQQEQQSTESKEHSHLSKSTLNIAELLLKRRSFSREPFEFRLTDQSKINSKASQSEDSSKDAQVLNRTEQISALNKEDQDPNQPSASDSESLLKRKPMLKEPIELQLPSQSSFKPSQKEENQKSLPNLKPNVPHFGEFNSVLGRSTEQLNMNDPNDRLLYFKELAAQRKAEAAKQAEAAKSKQPESSLKKSETQVKEQESVGKEANRTPLAEQEKKPVVDQISKDLPAAPVPILQISPQTITITDATDSMKREFKKTCSQSMSSLPLEVPAEKSNRSSTSSIATDGGDLKQDVKAMDFLKKGSQKLKEFLGQKGEKKLTEEKPVPPINVSVTEEPVFEDNGPLKQSDGHGATKPSKVENIEVAENKEDKTRKSTQNASAKVNQNRYQASASNVIYSSNLRDDTKVILEQISANSQKNRAEIVKHVPNDTEETLDGQGVEKPDTENQVQPTSKTNTIPVRSRFQRPQTNPEERDKLIKKMENMRKEKKVYSRFEVFYKNKDSGQVSDSESTDDDTKEKKSGKLTSRFGIFKSKK